MVFIGAENRQVGQGMEREEIKKRLRALPPAASTAFAVRVALRWLAFLSMEANAGLLGRIGLKRQRGFDYWRVDKKQTYLLAILYAQKGAVGVAMRSVIARNGAFERRYAAGDAYAVAITTAAADAAAAAYVAAAYAAAAYVSDAAAAADAAAATTIVTAADTATAKGIILLFAEKELNILWQQYEFDLQCLEKQSISNLLNSPLWHGAAPPTWQKQWGFFSKQLIELDASFAVWLQWLEDRIAGKPIDLPLLEQWLALPPEIASQPPAAINQYLANLGGSAKQALNRVRTIFIGYGDAGKTSLIRTLHGEPVVEGKEAMTPGIQIREWEGAGNDIITHFWDFGGQVMAHATHQFFLRASCLYVLVLSARAEINATEQAEYWLQHVQAFGGNATVMIVGNKHDQTPVHIDMTSLRAKYPNVLEFYPLSCTQALKAGTYQHKFNAFRADFCQQLTQLGTHQVMFTDAQFKVLTELRTRAAKQAFLPHSEFNALCQQHKIEAGGGQNREYFLDLLDKLGIVIHFKDLPFLSEHVLNPRWLTYGVYTVMYAARARLRLPEIVALLSDAEVRDEQGQTLQYPPEKCHFIATAMQYFKLCYHLSHDNDTFIIPGLLETDQPAALGSAGFNKTRSLAYKIAFTGFVPRHVMPEMIVERHEEIENELVWQYGVLLRHREHDARAWAQVDYQARELTIWVEGSDARDYLGLLRDNLLKILSRLTMKYEELIRLPVSALIDGDRLPPDGEDWADYAQIELHRKKNRASFLSGKREYDVGKIVGLYVPSGQQTGGDSYHFYGGQPKIIQPGGEMAGDKINNIHGGVVNGPVIAADTVENSFNTTTNNNVNPELAALLQQLLAEIQALNVKVPAAQATTITDLAQDSQQLVAETRRTEPRRSAYTVSLTGIVDAAKKIGEMAGPVLEVAEKIREFLGL